MSADVLIAGAILGALVLYALTGGADFGAGTWELLASGRTRQEQRDVIEEAIAPVWEANHVWLIVVVTVLFTGFPHAFSFITTVLHVPVLVLLLGIVLRGAAFTFRAHDPRGGAARMRWTLVFSIASLLAPLVLGTIVGAISSGRLHMNGWVVEGGFFRPWIALWPALVGLFTLAIFSFLAAVYLCVEANDQKSAALYAFRSRAIISWGAVTVLSWVLLAFARTEAPLIFTGLLERHWAWPLHAATAVTSLLALDGLVRGKWRRARFYAMLEVVFLVGGWGASQFPYLIVPDVTVANAAAPERTLHLLLGALVAGAALLFPSLLFLYRSFKGEFPFLPFERKP